MTTCRRQVSCLRPSSLVCPRTTWRLLYGRFPYPTCRSWTTQQLAYRYFSSILLSTSGIDPFISPCGYRCGAVRVDKAVLWNDAWRGSILENFPIVRTPRGGILPNYTGARTDCAKTGNHIWMREGTRESLAREVRGRHEDRTDNAEAL